MQKYYNNFDSAPTGVLADFTNIGGSNFQVGTLTPVSGTHSLSDASPNDGNVVILTAVAAQADMSFQATETVNINSGNISNLSLVVRANAAGNTFYMFNPLWNTGVVNAYSCVSGTYSQLGSSTLPFAVSDQDKVILKATAQGTTISLKMWKVGTSEPTTAVTTFTDTTVTAAGYAGFREGSQGSTQTTAADDVFMGDAGTVFAANSTAIGYSLTGSNALVSGSASSVTLANNPSGTFPASADTITYSDNLSPHGTFSPATQAVGTTGATSFSAQYTPPASYSGAVTLKATSANGLTAGTLSSTVSAPATVYQASNPLIHYTPYNWHPATGAAATMETNNSGASFSFTVSGSASVAMAFDTSSSVNSGVSIRYRIDALPSVSFAVASSVVVTLPDTGAHMMTVTVPYLTQSVDRWVTPASVVRLQSVTPSGGGTLSAVTGLPASKILVYSDSRGEFNSDATLDFPYLVAQAFGMEPGIRSFGSLGWSVVNASGSQAGYIVPLFTPGNEAQSGWDKYDSTHPLLTNGLYTPAPAMIVNLLGINDTRAGDSDAAVTASVQGVLAAQRGAAGPACQIMCCLDFSGDKRTAVIAGLNAYQQATPDANCFLVDIGTIIGLNDTGASWLSSDGAHPNPQGQAIVAAKLIKGIQAATQGVIQSAAPLSVAVSANPILLAGGAAQQFSASVSGPSNPSQAVTWTASAGTVTTAGLYTAPATASAVQTTTVTATSVQDPTKSGAASVTVPGANPVVADLEFEIGAPTVSLIDPTTALVSGGDGFIHVPVSAKNAVGIPVDLTQQVGGAYVYPVTVCPTLTVAPPAASYQAGDWLYANGVSYARLQIGPSNPLAPANYRVYVTVAGEYTLFSPALLPVVA